MGADYYESVDDRARNKDRGQPNIGLGSGTVIHRAIIDKNARIGSNVIISNDAGVQQGEGEGYVISDGIVVIPKDAIIPDGTRI
jgi:glucose-1-phosphate adenylyltransferase